MNIFDDFKPHFIFTVNLTTLMHFAREFIITLSISFISMDLAVGIAFGVCTAWEWQDGLHNDGFDIADWLAGLVGILTAVIIRG